MIKLFSPVKGKCKALEEVDDDVFSQKMMGDGVAVVPEDGKVYAPQSGEITMVFPTGHAVGLTTDEGVEILLHLGIDTVNLEGKYFQCNATSGAHVEKGDLLVDFNINAISKEGYDTDVMMIVTNSSSYNTINPLLSGDVQAQELLIEIS